MKNSINLILAVILVLTASNVQAQDIDARLNQMASDNVTNIWPDTVSNPAGIANYAMACFYNNTNISIANNFVNRFYSEFPVAATGEDFESYFWLHLIWRIYADPAMNSRLTTTAKNNIEEMMWNFVNQRSTVASAEGNVWKIDDSENHDAMQKGSYLICTQSLKNSASYGSDVLLNDGKSLMDHAAAWTEYFKNYFTVRAKEGINVEIASPTYSKYTLGVYHNIMDFAEDPALREIAKNFMDLYWADFVSDWTMSGMRGGARSRNYKDWYLQTANQLSSLTWAYGWHENQGTTRLYELIVAISSYRPPAILETIAKDANKPNYLYTSRRFGLDPTAGYLVEFDNGNSHIRRDTYVTPDYTMGTFTIDMSKDYIKLLDQNRAMGVYFSSATNDRVVVHGEGLAQEGRTGYNEIVGVCRENCMIVQRDINSNQSAGTDIYISNVIWDNHVDISDWFFSYSDGAYIGIRIADTDGYSDLLGGSGHIRRLSNADAPVIIQMDQASEYASFADFQTDVMNNNYSVNGSGVLNYTSNAGDTFTVYAGTSNTPEVNGVKVNLNPAMQYDSPYLSMVHGEDTATVSYPGYEDLKIPCNYQEQVLDCNGDINGTAYLDDCHECVGGNTGKEACVTDTVSFIEPIEDSFVRDGTYADLNYGTANVLTVKAGTPSLTRIAYLKFSLDTLQGNQINKALLKVYCSLVNTDPVRTISVYSTNDESWTETGITYNNAPTGSTFTGSFDVAAADEWYTIDVTDYINTQMDDKLVSFMLINEGEVTSNNNCNFDSREGSYPPILQIVENTIITNVSNEAKLPKLNVYPNPNKGVFNISVVSTDDLQLTVMDVNGREVYRDVINNQKGVIKKVIDISNQSTGIYYIRLVFNQENYVKKILKL